MQLGQRHVVGIIFHRLKDGCTAHSCFHLGKSREKAFHVPLSQTSANDEHQEEDMGWKQTPLFFPFS